MIPWTPAMTFCSIVGQARIQTARPMGPSTIERSNCCAGLSTGPLLLRRRAADHPRRPKTIGDHSKSRGPERLVEGEKYAAAFGECVEYPLRLGEGFVFDGDSEAIHARRRFTGRCVGRHQDAASVELETRVHDLVRVVSGHDLLLDGRFRVGQETRLSA